MSDLATIFFSFAILLPEYIILLFFWSGIVHLRQGKVVTWIALLGLLLLLSVIINAWMGKAEDTTIIVVLLSFAVLRIFCNGHWYVLFFSAAIGIVFLKGIDNSILYIVAMMFQTTPQSLLENVYQFTLLTMLSKTIEFLLAWLFRKHASKFFKNEVPHWQSWLQALPLPLATCFLMVASIRISQSSPQSAPLLLLLNVTFLALCILQIFIAKKLDEQKRNEADCVQLEQALELRKENLQSLIEAYAVQRSLTHDFNNHLGILMSLANQNRLEELDLYLTRIHGKVQECAIVVHTQNIIVDAILNQKYRIAVSKKIAIDFNMTDLSELTLPGDEIAVVLSNLLDNAIEACAQCKGKRLIWLKTKINDGNILLMISNTTENPPQIVDGELRTSKSDSGLHGFGLRNVNAILDAFHAEHAMGYKDGLFTFVAFIPIVTPL